MKNYSSEKDLYKLAKDLAYKFTLEKYKSFLIQNGLIRKDILDEPFGRFSRIIVKEEYIRETLLFLWPGERFDRLIEMLYGEGINQDPTDDKSVEKQESPRLNSSDIIVKSMFAVSHKLRVFLCHTSQDKPIVRELYQRLFAEGWIDPWLDEEKLLPGQDWDIEIEKAVETADVVVICLSNNSVTKEGYIQKELRFVLDVSDEKPEETIFVAPVRLDDCPIPRRLKKWQYVDYFPKDRKDWAYKRLLMSLDIRFQSWKDALDESVSTPIERVKPISSTDEKNQRNDVKKYQTQPILKSESAKPNSSSASVAIALWLWLLIFIGIAIAASR